jgi:hypothetical protein
MTDAEDEYSMTINYNDLKFQLPEPPTQIFNVFVGRDCGNVSLKEANNLS